MWQGDNMKYSYLMDKHAMKEWNYEDTCWRFLGLSVAVSEASHRPLRCTLVFSLSHKCPVGNKDRLLCCLVLNPWETFFSPRQFKGALTRMPGARSIIPSSRFHCWSLTEEKNLGPWRSKGPAFSQSSHFARFSLSATSTFICFSQVGVALTLHSDCFL